ncbi:MAG: cache domain-containing protein [Flavobacteriaceae bacterium]|nr:cache domain-containing protein [Flavobacteriaceae bacterium]
MNSDKKFTVQSISRPYIIALISIIIFFGLGILMLREKEITFRNNIAQNVYAEYVLESKKDYIKTAIDRKIAELQQQFNFQKQTRDSAFFWSKDFQDIIKKESLMRIKNMQLKKGGYVWVEEIYNYDGGDKFAIQLHNPTIPEMNNKWLSTNDKDLMGVKFYALMLDVVRNNKDPYFQYWYPKLGTDTITQKISYVKLFKPFDWVIGTGVHLDEIETFRTRSQSEFDIKFAPYKKSTFIYVLILLAITLYIALLHKKRIQNLIRFYISKVAEKEEQLIRFNTDLELIISDRTKDLQEINVQLKTAKEAAEESNKLKTAFLANMSHEVRTPMNSILGFSDLLTDKENTPAQIKRYVGFIQKSGQQLLNTINDILDVSKLEANQLEVSKEDISLNEILKNILTDSEKLHENPEITHTLLNPNLNDNIIISTDPTRFKQVFLKLIGNAYKFTNKGSITFGYHLNTQKKETELLFFVKDTGIGITKNKQHLIFNHFSQANDTEYRQGNGIGLSICKGLITLMGGEIWCDSEINKGSTFFFTLPFSSNPQKQ